MGVETRQSERKIVKKETKPSFFQNLLGSLFGGADSDALLKKQLKVIAKTFSKTKYHNFYKPTTIEVLPPFAKLFFDIYKIISPAQSLFTNSDNMALYKRQIINYSLSEKQHQILENLDDQKINELSRTVPIEVLQNQIENDIEEFHREYSSESLARTDNLYKSFSLFKDFCTFDYYALLKKFSGNFQENTFTYTPTFEKTNAEYVTEDLKDFCSIAYSIVDDRILWDDLFVFLKQIKTTELVSINMWKKIIAKIRSLKACQAFDLIIRHSTRNPSYQSEYSFDMPSIIEPFMDKVQEEAIATLSKISNLQRASKATNFCEQIFGKTNIIMLKNYSTAFNSTFEKKELNLYEYCEPLNYLKAFILEYVKKDIREFFDVVVIRGQWDSSLSAPMSNAYQELLKISDEISEFDSKLSEEGILGIKIKTLLPKTAHDPGAENIINRVIEDANQKAYSFMVTSTQNLITIGKTLKQLIEDYVKQKPTLIQNWRELERYLEHPMKEFSVNIYKKIYLFAQLMQQYIKH